MDEHFALGALSRAEGLAHATQLLERAIEDGHLTDRDAWLERALAPYYLDFDVHLAGAQHGLLRTAGALLLALEHEATADRLLERLIAGVLGHDADRYPLYLIGRLGRPAHVPPTSAWFRRRPARSIAHAGFPIYRLMADVLVRLKSDEVVDHVREVIADHDAGRIAMTANHRWTYDMALATLADGAVHRWQAPPIADP